MIRKGMMYSITAFAVAIATLSVPVYTSAATLSGSNPGMNSSGELVDAVDTWGSTSTDMWGLGFGSSATYDSITLDSSSKTITFTNFVTSSELYGAPGSDGYTWSFDGACEISAPCSESASVTLSVTPGSTLTLSLWYGLVNNYFTLANGTTSDYDFSSLSDSDQYNGTIILSGSASSESSSSSSSSVGETSAAGTSSSAESAPAPAPAPAFSNNTVTLADGSKLESVVEGQFISVEPVAFVKPGEAKDLASGAPVPAALPATYRASVSDVKTSDSPASTAVLNAFGTATGLDVACALNVNLVDSATTSLATTSAWSAVNNTSGLFAFPAISNGQLSTLYADEASLMVVNLEAGEGANAMIVGVTAGGTAFVQNDLDTNPNTATFLVLPGSGVYGVLS